MASEDNLMRGHPINHELHSLCHRAFSLSIG
jgi:hypothetical protein